MSGEKDLPICEDDFLEGSPPRRRGKVKPARWTKFHLGITPAWAGKSGRIQEPFHPYQDHPRVGGEKSAAPFSWTFVTGSPPHGRGKAAVHGIRKA